MPVTRGRRVWRPFGVLGMAPWRRGPLLLLRRAGVAGALLAASAVATLPAASATPYLSASRNAALHHQITAGCPWYAGIMVTSVGDFYTTFDEGALAPLAARTSAVSSSIPALGAAETTLIAPALGFGPTEVPGEFTYPLSIVYREGWTDHLELVAGSPDAPVWVPDAYADFIGVKAGDDFPVAFGSLGDVAIYRSLRAQPDQAWWCDLRSVYEQPAGNSVAPEVVFVDRATFVSVGFPGVTHRITFPLTDLAPDVDSARETVEQTRAAATSLGVSLRANPPVQDGRGQIVFSSRLPGYVGRADLVRDSLVYPVAPITTAGVLVGLLVVGAAGGYWVRRRRQELVMLAARGVGPWALAAKAVSETLPALVAGAALGWGGAWLLARWSGPDPTVSGAAARWALAWAAAAMLLGILTVGLVAGLACRRLADPARVRRGGTLGRLPYELVLLAAAPLAWSRLGAGHESVSEDDIALGAVVHLPTRLLVVPILVVAGLTILFARIMVLVLRRFGPAWKPRFRGTFLGWRRIGRHAAMVAVLAAATAVPVSLAAYGSVVSESVRTTIKDEARLQIGTDVVVRLSGEAEIPAGLPGEATLVRRIDSLRIGGVPTDLLVVDPESFEHVAYWRDVVPEGSVRDLLARSGSSGAPVVIAAGRTPVGRQAASLSDRPVFGGTVEVVRTGVLPAAHGGYSVAVVPDSAPLGFLAERGHQELWIRGDATQILPQLAAAHLPVAWIYVAAELYANTIWEPLTYTFTYLTALSLLAGVVTLVGLLLYLEAQTPARRRAYVLLRRMGMSAGSHGWALLGELAVPLAVGLGGGLAVAAGLIWVVAGSLDLSPLRPPDTVVDVPRLALGAIAAATVAVGILAVSYAQARIGRAKAAEVLRDAD